MRAIRSDHASALRRCRPRPITSWVLPSNRSYGRDLLPGQQLFDAGYVDAELLVTAQRQHQIEVVGPLSANSGWQSRAATGYGLEAFEFDWEAETALSVPRGLTVCGGRLGTMSPVIPWCASGFTVPRVGPGGALPLHCG